MKLENRVAIITGAAGAGIGQATARLLAGEGANVVVSDVHLGRATQVANDFLGRIYPPSFFEGVEKQIPLGRRGEPNDIARTILFLVSDDSDYITGETICVSGGWYMP
ncbi:MAG: SDR family oxidoreductase [Nitrospinae bacterium]|nr:SDR family oxidoreductase [Nitrospinota bacterium]